MTYSAICEIQKYLTYYSSDEPRTIVDITSLFKSHSPEKIIKFLRDLFGEKTRRLNFLIENDLYDAGLDMYICSMFRLLLAISALQDMVNRENEKENVNPAA